MLASQGAAVVSHRAAARLHRLDGFDRFDGLELTVARGRLHRLPAVLMHRTVRFEREDRVVVNGLPVTSPARTLCDLGAVVDDDLLEAALDASLRRGMPQKTLRRRLAELDRPGPSGTNALRRVLDRPDRAGRLPDSRFERLADWLVRRHGLPPPQRQFVVRGPDGDVLGRLDLAWPEVRLGRRSAE